MAPVSGPASQSRSWPEDGRRRRSQLRSTPLGMAITPVSEEIGVASATKLCRSIVIKGMEALMVDLNFAAGKAGVPPAVLESLTACIRAWIGRSWPTSCRLA